MEHEKSRRVIVFFRRGLISDGISLLPTARKHRHLLKLNHAVVFDSDDYSSKMLMSASANIFIPYSSGWFMASVISVLNGMPCRQRRP